MREEGLAPGPFSGRAPSQRALPRSGGPLPGDHRREPVAGLPLTGPNVRGPCRTLARHGISAEDLCAVEQCTLISPSCPTQTSGSTCTSPVERRCSYR